MYLALNKRSKGQIEFGIIYGGIALLVLLIGRFLPVLALAPACAFRTLPDLPCPTCGSTRSLVHLSHGDIVSAFGMNPLTAACILAAVLYLVYSFLTLVCGLPRICIALAEKEKDRMRVFAVLILLLNWVYLLFAL